MTIKKKKSVYINETENLEQTCNQLKTHTHFLMHPSKTVCTDVN